MLGSRPRRDGMIHIWMNRMGSIFDPLRSECCIPEPSVARWTEPGGRMPPFPRESACSKVPSAT